MLQATTDPGPNCHYNLVMVIDFDPAKNNTNIVVRGLSFTRAADFDFDTANTREVRNYEKTHPTY